MRPREISRSCRACCSDRFSSIAFETASARLRSPDTYTAPTAGVFSDNSRRRVSDFSARNARISRASGTLIQPDHSVAYAMMPHSTACGRNPIRFDF